MLLLSLLSCKSDTRNLCHLRGMGVTANTHFRSGLGSGRGSPSAPRSVDLGLDHDSQTPQTGPLLRPQPRSTAAESSVLERTRATLPASTHDPPPPLELQNVLNDQFDKCVRVCECVSSNLHDAMRVPPQTLRVQVIINGHKPRRLWRYDHWGRTPGRKTTGRQPIDDQATRSHPEAP